MIEKLIEENDLLIKSISLKFYNVEKEDLYQAGCLGLIKAYQNYKDEYGNFSGYAYKYIFGEMYELSIKSRDIKLNKYYLKIYKLITETSNYLTQKLGKEITTNEISEYTGIPVTEIDYVRVIMEKSIELDDEYKKIDIGYQENYDNNIMVNESLNTLDPLSSLVMKYRYFNDYTQEEVGKALGLSQVKVSRIEKNSKKKILEYLS